MLQMLSLKNLRRCPKPLSGAGTASIQTDANRSRTEGIGAVFMNRLCITAQMRRERSRMADIKLKPCPFCGGEARLVLNAKRKIYGKDEYRTGVVACCNVCEARMFYGSEKLAIEAWNRRSQLERPKGEWVLKKELVPLPWDCSPLPNDDYDAATHSVWQEYYHCSNCDWKSGEFKGGNFCSNCGTDMRGEHE